MKLREKTHDERAYEALLDGLFGLRNCYGTFRGVNKSVLIEINTLLIKRRQRSFEQRSLERALFLMESLGPLPMDYHHTPRLEVRSALFSICGQRAMIVYWPFRSTFFVQRHSLPCLLIGALRGTPFCEWVQPTPQQIQTALDWRLWVRSFFETARKNFTSKNGIISLAFPWTENNFTSLTTRYELIARYSRLRVWREPLLRVFRKLPPLLRWFTQRTEERDYVLTVAWRSIAEARSPFSTQRLSVSTLIPNPNYRDELSNFQDPLDRLVWQLSNVFHVQLSASYLTDLHENADGRMDSRTKGLVNVLGFMLEFFRAVVFDEQQVEGNE